MKEIKLKLAILFFIISCLGLNAQNAQNGISNLTINPTNPNATSQVKAIANCMFGGMNCAFKGSTVTINNDTITVIAKHQVGLFMAICYTTDTIAIGQLPLGNYTLIFHLKEFNYNATYDIDTLNFTVTAPTGLPSNIKTKDVFNVFPNPVKDKLSIEFKEANLLYRLTITNLLGEIVYSTFSKNLKEEIDLEYLRSGIYVLTVENEKGKQAFKIVKE